MVGLERRGGRGVAGAERSDVNRRTERLVAVEGLNGGAMTKAARAIAADHKTRRPAVSVWDASGILGEVALADVGAGQPSARTLLLLYAADLAYRLRWDVSPALGAGRLVVVVPWVDTAVALGRAAGIEEEWLANVFGFAPLPSTRHLVDAPPSRAVAARRGFAEFACRQILGDSAGARLELLERAGTGLKKPARSNPS